MQREKLHNLHRTAYFTVALIYFENRQNSSRSNFDVVKKVFFAYAANAFFSYLSPDMFYLKKKKIHHKMQREKLYNLQRTVHIIYTAFFIKKKQNCE